MNVLNRAVWSGDASRDKGRRSRREGEILIMAIALTENILRDNMALTVAKVLSVANQRAEAAGINAVDSLISVNQFPRAEGGAWQVEYGPQNAVGRRGGRVDRGGRRQRRDCYQGASRTVDRT